MPRNCLEGRCHRYFLSALLVARSRLRSGLSRLVLQPCEPESCLAGLLLILSGAAGLLSLLPLPSLKNIPAIASAVLFFLGLGWICALEGVGCSEIYSG
jgi:hypothetical protein